MSKPLTEDYDLELHQILIGSATVKALYRRASQSLFKLARSNERFSISGLASLLGKLNIAYREVILNMLIEGKYTPYTFDILPKRVQQVYLLLVAEFLADYGK